MWCPGGAGCPSRAAPAPGNRWSGFPGAPGRGRRRQRQPQEKDPGFTMAQSSPGRAARAEPPLALKNPKIGYLHGAGHRGRSTRRFARRCSGRASAAPAAPSSARRGDSSEPSCAAPAPRTSFASTPLLLPSRRGCRPALPPAPGVESAAVMLLEFQPNCQIPACSCGAICFLVSLLMLKGCEVGGVGFRW